MTIFFYISIALACIIAYLGFKLILANTMIRQLVERVKYEQRQRNSPGSYSPASPAAAHRANLLRRVPEKGARP